MTDTLHFGGGLKPRGLNPLCTGNDWNEVSCALFSRLFYVDARGAVAPDLVERYAVSDDGLNYTFHLHDAWWHDMQPFTAHAVEFTIETIFDQRLGLEMAANLNMLAGSHAEDERTWVAHVKDVSPSFLSALTDAPMLPRHILRGADFNGDVLDRNPVGTGAYKLARKSDDLTYELTAHDPYHHGKPNVPRLTITIVPDDDERAERMRDGAFDICQVKAQHVEKMRQSGLMVYRFRAGAWRGMPQNFRRAMLQDKRVRQAISIALDRDEIVSKALPGVGSAAYLPIAPSSWVYDESLVTRGRDVPRARRLLAEAGFVPGPDGMLTKNGERFEYYIGIWKDEVFRRTSGPLVQKQLAEVGIAVNLLYVDNATYVKIGDDPGQTYDTIIGGWSGLLDPDISLSKKFHSQGSQNPIMAYHNSEVDRLLELGRVARTEEARKPIYRDVLRILVDEQPWIPVAYPDYVFAAKPTLRGLREGETVDSWYHLTERAWQWS
jgi:peptide/nickel transport system substrate-binding protein